MIDKSIYCNEQHEMLRETIRRFVDAEVRPYADQWELDGMTPRSTLRQMGELGLLGIRYPEKYGGSELDTIATVIFAEELGRSTYGGFAVTALVHTDMASPHLANAGNEAQRDKYMPGIVTGETITAVAVSEPDAGSDVAGLRTRAVADGDDWVINGSKMFITNGVHADLYFVAARTDPSVKGSRGITMFLVEAGTEGFRVGRELDKMGWRSSDTAELVFEDCRVPAENIVGEVNKGFYAIMMNFQNERLVVGAQAMGEAQQALDMTIQYVRERKAFGSVLWDKQVIRQRLAERQGEVAAARQLLYHTAWLDAQGLDCVQEVSMVKALCAELNNKLLYDCLQFHGGAGYLRETGIERMVRDARVETIGGGATEVMLEEVAKRL
ncbi:MAG TPA: acyl-CoA dehydrogenase family protein [Gammaproteobacteria bacterium]|jgi:acyl-CoA dehydrogenase|nr:acyl-CoA dehydrogenase family protein [Gammaproteobacteria bacterium]